MKRFRLPPLELLETFESAARHLSFTRAGDELALTQSAVSRQIAALEDGLGVPLFHRLHRSLRLTDAGQQLHSTASAVLQQLHDVTDQLRPEHRPQSVVVTTTPGFAGLWLIPRLADFTARHPGVDVRMSANLQLVHLERDGVDLAIRYTAAERAGVGAVELFGEVVTPVCSPALLKRHSAPLKHPQDLRQHTLLYADMTGDRPGYDWALWLQAMKLEAFKPAASLHFSDYDQMINAALRGQGVALGRLPLIQQLLKERKLVAPFDDRVASPHGYFLLRSASTGSRPEVRAFAEWLLAQAAA